MPSLLNFGVIKCQLVDPQHSSNNILHLDLLEEKDNLRSWIRNRLCFRERHSRLWGGGEGGDAHVLQCQMLRNEED